MPGTLEIQNLTATSVLKAAKDQDPAAVEKNALSQITVNLMAVPFDDFKGTVRFEYEVDPVPAGGQPDDVYKYVEGDGTSDEVPVTNSFDTTDNSGEVTVTAYKNAEQLDQKSTEW